MEGERHLPDWERLWDNFIQKEIRVTSIQGGQQQGDDDEKNVALSAKGKNKSKKAQTSKTKSKGEQKRT